MKLPLVRQRDTHNNTHKKVAYAYPSTYTSLTIIISLKLTLSLNTLRNRDFIVEKLPDFKVPYKITSIVLHVTTKRTSTLDCLTYRNPHS